MVERDLTAADFEYPLPEELIAQTPPVVRGESKLLVVDRRAGVRQAAPLHADGRVEISFGDSVPPLRDCGFADLLSLIPSGDLLVLNSTRVRHARLLGTRPGGGNAEVLLLHPMGDDQWLAMGRPGHALRPGKRIRLSDDVEVETVVVQDDGFRQVRFVGADAATAITRFGQLPLPPYISRAPNHADELRYQTVYADREGSVAAPTAGLHFTTELLDKLRDQGVEIASLDLEVGPGTFKPVEADNPRDHEMHAERFDIPPTVANAIATARERGAAVWAVGTTVVRALESAARGNGTVTAGPGETRLLILPGYRFTVVDHLLTNFHLPRSTLLMLVAAFAGYDLTMAAYRHAVAAKYRFYSYGDAMCIL